MRTLSITQAGVCKRESFNTWLHVDLAVTVAVG